MLHLQEIAINSTKMAPVLSEMRAVADFMDWWDHIEVAGVQAMWDGTPIPIPAGVEPLWVVHLLVEEGLDHLGVITSGSGWSIKIKDPKKFESYLLPNANAKRPDPVTLLVEFRQKWLSTFYFLEAFCGTHGPDMADRVGPFRPFLRLLARYQDEVDPYHGDQDIPF